MIMREIYGLVQIREYSDIILRKKAVNILNYTKRISLGRNLLLVWEKIVMEGYFVVESVV